MKKTDVAVALVEAIESLEPVEWIRQGGHIQSAPAGYVTLKNVPWEVVRAYVRLFRKTEKEESAKTVAEMSSGDIIPARSVPKSDEVITPSNVSRKDWDKAADLNSEKPE